ncbi:MAG: hypothetical protein GC154_07745 [bacterium]|nr:hypothetical protein [bacterium]
MRLSFRLITRGLAALLILALSYAARAAEPAALVYSASHVMDARALASRVNWREGMIDQQSLAPQNLAGDFWRASVKAALFGERERLNAAEQALRAALEAAEPARSSLEDAACLLEGYDLLMALPEWAGAPAEQKQTLAALWAGRADEALGSAPGAQGFAAWRALEWYAGALLKRDDFAQAARTGDAAGPALTAALQDRVTSDGLYGRSIGEHLQTAEYVTLAASALKSASPEAFVTLSPFADAMVNATIELTWPNGVWPASLSSNDASPRRTSRLLERGYAALGDLKASNLLKTIYQTAPRPAENALIGEIILPRVPLSMGSALMPQSGAAILRGASNGATAEVTLDSGISRFGAKAGLLSVHIQSNDGRAAGSSRVVIDGMEQIQPADDPATPQNALVADMKEIPQIGTYVTAQASGVYGERAAYANNQIANFSSGTYQRALYQSGDLLIDLFWVRGGSKHEFQATHPGGWEQPDAGTAFVRSRSKDPLAERLWLANPNRVQTRVDAADPSLAVFEYDGQPGDGNLFAAVHEYSIADASGETAEPDTKIEMLRLDPAPNDRNFQAIAFTVVRGQRADLFFASLDPDQEYKTRWRDSDFTLKGEFAHVHITNGLIDWLYSINGTNLQAGNFGVKTVKPIQYGALGRVDQAEDLATSVLDYPMAIDEPPMHESLLALDQDAAGVIYQPIWVKALDYRFEPNEPQRMQVIQPALDMTGPANAGIRLRGGLQVIYHNLVLLTRRVEKGHEIYHLVTTNPVTVRVPVWNDLTHIYFTQSTIIDRRRGEAKDGVIEFTAQPTETNNGMMEFLHYR